MYTNDREPLSVHAYNEIYLTVQFSIQHVHDKSIMPTTCLALTTLL